MEHIRRGDVVRVNDKVYDPDLPEFSVAFWQGRVTEIFEDDNFTPYAVFTLDSITLQNIPENHIKAAIDEGLDYLTMTLPITDLSKAEPRDKIAEVNQVAQELEKIYFWYEFGQQGERIQKLLKQAQAENETEMFGFWWKYLKDNAPTPFDAEPAEEEPVVGNFNNKRIRVLAIASIDPTNGVLVKARIRNRETFVPLANYQVIDSKHPAYEAVEDYGLWFDNRDALNPNDDE